MKKKSFKLVLVFLLGVFPLFSFAQSKFNLILDYHYQLGLSEKGEYNISRKDSKMYGNSLHLSGMYHFTKRIAAGVGVGADRYEEPGYNTFPIFASVHYSPLSNLPDVYTYTNLGYAIIDKNDTHSGLMWDLGIGYKKMFRSHFGLNFQFGYNLKQFRNIDSYTMIDDQILQDKENRTRHSLSFGVGLIF